MALDERAMEEEAERKIGWFLKLLFAGTATLVGYQFLPYLGMQTVSSISVITLLVLVAPFKLIWVKYAF